MDSGEKTASKSGREQRLAGSNAIYLEGGVNESEYKKG